MAEGTGAHHPGPQAPGLLKPGMALPPQGLAPSGQPRLHPGQLDRGQAQMLLTAEHPGFAWAEPSQTVEE